MVKRRLPHLNRLMTYCALPSVSLIDSPKVYCVAHISSAHRFSEALSSHMTYNVGIPLAAGGYEGTTCDRIACTV